MAFKFSLVNCACEDARFLYGLSNDNFTTYKTEAVPKDTDAAEWKARYDALGERPLLAFALPIDFYQTPAMKAMEANKWKLVAIGLRGHDREINEKKAFAKLYMKKFPKTGKLYPAVPVPVVQPDIYIPPRHGLSCSYSCSFMVYDYEFGQAKYDAPVGFNSGYGDGKSMILHRIPTAKLETFKFPETNFVCITRTKIASYYLSNAVELFVEAK